MVKGYFIIHCLIWNTEGHPERTQIDKERPASAEGGGGLGDHAPTSSWQDQGVFDLNSMGKCWGKSHIVGTYFL